MATAAVRDAADGADFAREAARRSGLEVRVLSGAEEAEAAAAGVFAGIPEARGVMGDLGGGSLELARLEEGRATERASLPLGPLSLRAAAEGSAKRARALVDDALAGLPWLAEAAAGAELYAVGGAWRALARVDMARRGYPLRIVHRYRRSARDTIRLAALVAGQSRDSLARMGGAPRRRLDLLPLAALALERLLRAAAPRRVVFSALGLREGLVHARLPAEVRAEDPLLAACRDIADRAARLPGHGAELAAWTDGLFPGETADERRLRRAACLLGGAGWRLHPDHRAEHAAAEVLHAPTLYASHTERCFLARAVFARYTGRDSAGVLRAAERRLLTEAERARARVVGLAARLGETLSAGAPGILGRFPLALAERPPTLRLGRGPGDRRLVGEAAMRRFENLAAALGRAPAAGGP